jgi:hypothetical protein
MPRPKRSKEPVTDAPASKRAKEEEKDKDATSAAKEKDDVKGKTKVAPASEPTPTKAPASPAAKVAASPAPASPAAKATTDPADPVPAAKAAPADPVPDAKAAPADPEPTAKAAPATPPTVTAPAPAAKAAATAATSPAKAATTATDTELFKPSPKPKTRAGVSVDRSPTDPAFFNDYIFQLLFFKANNNNFHVTKEEDANVHAFLQHLKKEYKAYASDSATSVLTPEQMKVLEFLHVPLTSRGDDHWNRFFELLQQYGERHGHVLVPRLCEVPGLGDWVTDQRRQYKAWHQGQPSQLTKERREKLQGIGFAWQVRNRPEWEHRYQELLEYKAKHNDCKVPQHYKENRALGKWVAKQREQFKLLKKGQHSFLTPYRLEKLNNIGFVWQTRTALEGEEDTPPPVAADGDGSGAPAAPSPAIPSAAVDAAVDAAVKAEVKAEVSASV